jgi:uncharacterized protein YcbX
VRVAGLAIAPVKGLALVAVDEVEIGPHGVDEDRRFFMLDPRGDVVTLRRHPQLAPVRPAWRAAERVLTLALPDGEAVEAEVVLGEPAAARLYDKDRVGHEVRGPFSEALSAVAGERIRLVHADAAGTGWDEAPVSIVSRASLAEVAREAGRPEVDARRFRMLVEADGPAAHEEDGWVGREVALGEARVRVVAPIERCVVITRDPDTGARDWDGLHVLARLRGPRDVRLGVGAEVTAPGRAAVGDALVPAV